MKNLNELEKVIKEALPELMELKVGCILKYKLSETIYKIAGGNDKFIYCVNGIENRKMLSKDDDCIEIIGQEIQLIHVLKWMKLIYPNKHDFWAQRFKLLEYWNLDENLLKNQSKELIDFLFNLIQN
jgi:uncharacterized protein YqfB (UPF0267 family)